MSLPKHLEERLRQIAIKSEMGAASGCKPAPTIDPGTAMTRLRRAGAPLDATATLRALIMKQIKPSRATEAAASWWDGMRQERPLLAFLGPTGLGKSTAAAWAGYLAAREYPWNSQAGGSASWEPIVWLNAEDIVLLQGWFTDGKRQYEEASRCWLLIIDDAGHEASRPAIAALTDLLQRRMDKRKSTVLSTNLRGAGFATRYGAPVVDRMKVHAFVPELGKYESLRGREPGEEG